MQVTVAQVRRFAPNARGDIVSAIVKLWPEAVAAGISTPLRTCGIFSQMYPESGGLRIIEENLNYSAKRLMQVWPKRFPTMKVAQQYANNPRKLAIYVYGGRNGNAAAPSEDGWTFRGSGLGQTTGRANFRAAGYEKNPEYLRSNAEAAFRAAIKFWQQNGLSRLADAGDVTAMRKRWNGGTNGLTEAREAFARARTIWPDARPVAMLSAEQDAVAMKAVAPEPVAPEPAPEPITDAEAVERVQGQLKALGYSEVGEVDGKLLGRTEAAILAFRNDNGLPLVPVIDADLASALVTARPRPVSEKRATATAADLAPQSAIIRDTGRNKVLAWFLGIPAGIVSLGSGVIDNMRSAADYLAPVKEVLSDIPVWAYAGGVVVAAALIWHYSNKAEQARVEMHRKGEA